MKYLFLSLVILAGCRFALADEAYHGSCSQNNVTLTIPGMSVLSQKVNGTFATASTNPCTVSVYLSGLSSVGITSIVRSSNVVTATLASSIPSYAVGASAVVTGVSTSSFNGTFVILSVPTTNQVTWSQTAANASSSGGSAALLAAIYANNTGTVLANPFTCPTSTACDSTGNFVLYAANGRYDVRTAFTGSNLPHVNPYTSADWLLNDPTGGAAAASCNANLFTGDLAQQTAAAFASGCTVVYWSGSATISTGPVIVGSNQAISCGAGTYTEINGGTTPTAIEFVNGTQNAGFFGTGGCNVVNHQTAAYNEGNNVPSATFIVCSQTVANCDNTAPDVSTLLTANCLVGSASCSVTSVTGFSAGQDVVIGSTRGDSAYVISPTWNGSNPVTFTRPMDDSYTTANGAFLGYFTNGFTKNITIQNVNITGNCAGTGPCVGHGLFFHNAFYYSVSGITAYGLGGRIAVANGYSAFMNYDNLFYDASKSISSTNNGFEPCYVLTSHCRASNSTVVGAPANCIAVHGYHEQTANLQGYGCGESGLQLDTLEDYSDSGSHYGENGTNGINVAGDSGQEYATDIDLNGDTVDNNQDNGVGAGIGGNVKIKIRGLKAYGNLGNNAADGGGVFFDAVQAGSMVTDSIICGGARGIYLDGTNSYITVSNVTFQPQGNCTANTVGDIIVRSSSGALTNSEFTNLNFGASQPIPTATCTYLTGGSLANTFWGLTNLQSQCSASSGIWSIPSSITLASQGLTLNQLTSMAFSGTGTPTMSLNGADAIVIGSTTAGGGTFPLLTVSTLPSATANNGSLFVVSDSTTISAEGQTCVGSSTTRALAFASGGLWKCF